MFCQYCGAQIDDSTRFCTACGKARIGSSPAAQPVDKLASHLKTMSVLWIVYSAFCVLMSAWTLAFSRYVLLMMPKFMPHDSDIDVTPLFGMLRGAYGIMFVYSLAAGALGIAAGWGLFQRRPWGRVLGLVAAFASILSFPFGTALAVYTLMILLGSGAEDSYRRLAVPA